MLRPKTKATASRRGTLGSLESLALPEIVQSLAMGRKTARLSLTSEGRWGHIWIEDGHATHARTRRAVGELAFYEMVGWKNGRFLIEPDVRSDTRSLDHDPMFLVMEGCRRLDESTDGAAPPGPESPLSAAPIPLDRVPAGPPPAPVPTSPAAGAGLVSRRTGPPKARHPRRRILLLSILAAELILFLPARALLERAAMSVGATGPAGIASGAPMPGDFEAEDEPAAPGETPADEADTAEGIVPEREAPSPANRRTGPPEPAREPAARRPAAPTPAPGEREAPPGPPDADADAVAAGRNAAAADAVDAVDAAGGGGEAFVKLAAESKVRGGTLTVLVDGRPVYSRELGDGGPRLGIFGRKGETFEALIPLPAGRCEIEARVAPDGEAERFEDSVVLSLEPGTTREIRLVAGRKRGREISLAVSELASVSAREID